MTTSAAPSSISTTRVTIPVLGVCVALSVLVHLGSALGAGVYLSQRGSLDLSGVKRIRLPDMAPPPVPEGHPLRLGRQDSRSASIAWLGVVRDPVVGQGQESQVEQAELTIQQGERDAPAATQTAPSPPTQSPAQPPTETTAEPIQPEPEPEQEPQPKPEQRPEQAPSIPLPDLPEPVIEPSASEPETPEVRPDSQPQPQPQPEPESEPETRPIPESEPEPEPEPEVPSQETASAAQKPTEAAQSTPVTPPAHPTPAGKPGEVDDRESVASIIRRAQEVRATSLNRPLSGEGLEIKPVEPKFPATVRFTQLPRNPIVLIRFNAEGKVVRAAFLRDEEKRRTYDTGSKGVDEPLINAIYQWRAEGKQIDALDPSDPESTIEISMKIIFRTE